MKTTQDFLDEESVEVETKEELSSTILLPENVILNESPFSAAKLIRASRGSEMSLWQGLNIVVPSHVIESCTYDGETYHLVLESHVVGCLSEDDG